MAFNDPRFELDRRGRPTKNLKAMDTRSLPMKAL
jgi:hypothetical protein